MIKLKNNKKAFLQKSGSVTALNNILLFILYSVAAVIPQTLTAQSYLQDINAWYQKRVKDLTAENGWLNLAGLYWLEQGKNSFGSGNGVKLKFPEGSIAPDAGYLELNGSTVTQFAGKGIKILVNGQPAEKAVVFEKGLTPAPVSAYNRLRWTIIKRGDKIGVRLRNLENAAVTKFRGIAHFQPDSTWVVTATLHVDPLLQNISIRNILGQTIEEKSPGKLYFTLRNKQYTLDALEENNKLFVIFTDLTNGETTYPTGRFLVAEKTTDGGTTILDFNKAYNPPCAFSDYATCPVPPAQNAIPIAITAGEKTYGHH